MNEVIAPRITKRRFARIQLRDDAGIVVNADGRYARASYAGGRDGAEMP